MKEKGYRWRIYTRDGPSDLWKLVKSFEEEVNARAYYHVFLETLSEDGKDCETKLVDVGIDDPNKHTIVFKARIYGSIR